MIVTKITITTIITIVIQYIHTYIHTYIHIYIQNPVCVISMGTGWQSFSDGMLFPQIRVRKRSHQTGRASPGRFLRCEVRVSSLKFPGFIHGLSWVFWRWGSVCQMIRATGDQKKHCTGCVTIRTAPIRHEAYVMQNDTLAGQFGSPAGVCWEIHKNDS